MILPSRLPATGTRTAANAEGSSLRKVGMRITLGVTGGVAAYKAAELVRRLQQDGFSVQVVMTRGAREFLMPLTFAALTGQKVITDLSGDPPAANPNSDSPSNPSAVRRRPTWCLVRPVPRILLQNLPAAIATVIIT